MKRIDTIIYHLPLFHFSIYSSSSSSFDLSFCFTKCTRGNMFQCISNISNIYIYTIQCTSFPFPLLPQQTPSTPSLLYSPLIARTSSFRLQNRYMFQFQTFQCSSLPSLNPHNKHPQHLLFYCPLTIRTRSFQRTTRTE
jgi:hypothetical protein